MKMILVFTLFLGVNDLIAATSPSCPGQEGYFYTNYRRRNPQAGGFVANTAYVEDNDSLFLAPTAAVCDSAQVLDAPRILGHSIIRGNAEVYGNAAIKGEVIIEGDSRVFGNARIQDKAIVRDSSVSGDAVLKGWFKAIDTTISSGEHFAPEISEEEVERRRQEEERRRLRLAKALSLKIELQNLLKQSIIPIIEKSSDSTHISTIDGRALIKEDNIPCELTLLSSRHSINASDLRDPLRDNVVYSTLNMGFFKHIQIGHLYIWDGPLSEMNFWEAREFHENIRINHPNYVEKFEYKVYAPGIAISNSTYVLNPEYRSSYWKDKLKQIGTDEDFLIADKNDKNVNFTLTFSSIMERDFFLNKFSEYYNTCPAPK